MELPDRIYALGAGRMGQGIALAFIFAGVPAVLIDYKDRTDKDREIYFAHIRANIEKELKALARLGLMDEGKVSETLSRLRLVDRTGAEAELSSSQVVFEGVPEVMDMKRDAFTWLDQHIPSTAIVASTTSTIPGLPILNRFMSHPERFFKCPLVESGPPGSPGGSELQ